MWTSPFPVRLPTLSHIHLQQTPSASVRKLQPPYSVSSRGGPSTTRLRLRHQSDLHLWPSGGLTATGDCPVHPNRQYSAPLCPPTLFQPDPVGSCTPTLVGGYTGGSGLSAGSGSFISANRCCPVLSMHSPHFPMSLYVSFYLSNSVTPLSDIYQPMYMHYVVHRLEYHKSLLLTAACLTYFTPHLLCFIGLPTQLPL